MTKTDVAGFGAEKLGYEYIHAGVCEAVSTIARQARPVATRRASPPRHRACLGALPSGARPPPRSRTID